MSKISESKRAPEETIDEELPPPYEELASPSVPPFTNARPPASSVRPSQQNIQFHQQHQNHQQYPPQGIRPPFNYPPGYFCTQCNNTGIKCNGHPCGTCERAFGGQTAPVMYAPYGIVPSNAVTYMAGDPRIGGRLCGNCKGHGIRSSLFGMVEEQCYVCQGIGRIL